MLGLQLYLLLLPAWPDVGAVVGGDVVLLHAVAAVPVCLLGGPGGVAGDDGDIGLLLPLSAHCSPAL